MTRVERIGKFDVRRTDGDERPYWLTNRCTGAVVKDDDGKPMQFAEVTDAVAWAIDHQRPVQP